MTLITALIIFLAIRLVYYVLQILARAAKMLWAMYQAYLATRIVKAIIKSVLD